jgi:hypothetical protein
MDILGGIILQIQCYIDSRFLNSQQPTLILPPFVFPSDLFLMSLSIF